jgi:hypothetical protein
MKTATSRTKVRVIAFPILRPFDVSERSPNRPAIGREASCPITPDPSITRKADEEVRPPGDMRAAACALPARPAFDRASFLAMARALHFGSINGWQREKPMRWATTVKPVSSDGAKTRERFISGAVEARAVACNRRAVS